MVTPRVIFFLTKLFHMLNIRMRKKRTDLPSEFLYRQTDAQQSNVALRRTHDAVHRQVSKKLAQWGLSVPKYKDSI